MKAKMVVALLRSDQEFQQMQAADAKATATRMGVDVEVVFAENNAIQQIHQLYQYVYAPDGERPAAFIVEAVSRDGMERLARNAIKAGIAWVVQQWKTGYVDRLRAESPGMVSSVCVDEDEIGRLQAQQLEALLPDGGAVLFLQGPLESDTAVHRMEGLRNSLPPGVHLKRVLNGDWTADGASKAVASWMRLKTAEGERIDLVAAQNDSMAEGARQTILGLREDWARVPFTGCDGLPNGGRRLVAEGKLTATIIKPTTTGPAIELVARRLRGESAPVDLVLRAESHPALERLDKGRERF